MSSPTFEELKSKTADGADAAIDHLIATLKKQGELHRVFDALLMKTKHRLGLPLGRPTSFDDVPEDQAAEFEKEYVSAARETGQLLLDDGRIGDAWNYFRTIREPGPVRSALDAISTPTEADDRTDELINVALYEQAHPVKGLEVMLRSHGTCNTVTAMDQVQHELSAADREAAAALLVDQLHVELTSSLTADVQQRMAFAPTGTSIRELIAGREWLFAEGNYHIDVSHLNAVVRFSRALSKNNASLQKAIELTLYGEQLDQQFQYGGDAPFDDFYVAHKHFLRAVAGEEVEAALAYFQSKLDEEPDAEDKPPIAMVLIDLQTRVGKTTDAVNLAAEYADPLEQMAGFSLAEFCQETGHLKELEEVSERRGDLIGFTAAILSTKN